MLPEILEPVPASPATSSQGGPVTAAAATTANAKATLALHVARARSMAATSVARRVFSGQLGGPMAGLTPLVGEVLGVETGEPVRFAGMFHPAGSAPDAVPALTMPADDAMPAMDRMGS